MIFKPMLAASIDDITKLKFPLLASPKLDGVRAVIIDGAVMSRSLKPIPNAHVQKLFGQPELNGLDGELIVGVPTSQTVFRDTSSAVMRRDGEPEVTFYVFDDISNPEDSFMERLVQAENRLSYHCTRVPHVLVESTEQLEAIENDLLEKGFEGVMLRDPNGRYKYGRSTLKEGLLLKLKQFSDSEAKIIGFVEQMHNSNEATRDELGNLKRSSAKAGLIGKNTLGALQVRDLVSGVEFEIGTGFDDKTRAEVWANQDKYLGQLIKYQYFPSGSKDKPRFPKFHGFRSNLDI